MTSAPGPPPRRGLAITSLVLGILGIPTFGCFFIGAAAGVVLGIVALMRANREPHIYGGKGIAVAGVATSTLSLVVALPLAIAAAIAIPALLRARVNANEATTRGDVQAVMAAQDAYRSISGGFYGPPQCLATPKTCLPEYSGPGFIDPELAALTERSGYRRTFHPGPAASANASPPGSPFATGNLEGFAYTAVPADRDRTGERSFCGDASGRVCAVDGGEIDASSGSCPPPPECPDL